MWYISVRESETLSSMMTHLIRRVLNYWDSVFPFGGILSLPLDQEEEKEKFWAVWLLPRSRRDDGSHMWKIWSMIWNYFLIFLILQSGYSLPTVLTSLSPFFIASVSSLEYSRFAFTYKKLSNNKVKARHLSFLSELDSNRNRQKDQTKIPLAFVKGMWLMYDDFHMNFIFKVLRNGDRSREAWIDPLQKFLKP